MTDNKETKKAEGIDKNTEKEAKLAAMLAASSRSSSSGSRGEVGMGLGGEVEIKQRRRQPKDNAFLKGLLIYVCVALLLIGSTVVICWGYADSWEEGRPEVFMDELVFYRSDAEWKEMLTEHLPATYPAYENAEKLANEVFAPVLKLGKISYIRLPSNGAPQYLVFSDGKPLVHVLLRDTSSGLFGLGSWEVDRMFFYVSYFDEISFSLTSVTLPTDATLYVNGVMIDEERAATDARYPALNRTEQDADVAPCKKYTFNDLYYLPTLTAKLGDVDLTLEMTGEGEYYFRYPESATHTLTVTAPVGVDVFVGGVKLDESWAHREEIEGELGSLDDGGTGTKPILSVWSIDGIFGQPEVSAKIGASDVSLLSSADNKYVFDTPAECKYTVTVVLPVSAELYINGKAIPATEKISGGATAEILASGFTSIGKYEAGELDAVPEAVPQFDMYVITGYLALPNIAAKMNGDFITSAGMSVNSYDVRCDFDYTAGSSFDTERLESAKRFTQSYLEYICDGGAWLDPANAETFKANYAALKAQMVEGTAGYVGVMESYRDVNKLPRYDSFTFDQLEGAEFVTYSDASVSCAVDFKLTRTRTVDGTELTDTLSGRMMILQVLYKGEWRVWSFVYTEAVDQ